MSYEMENKTISYPVRKIRKAVITEEHTALLFVWIEVQGLPNRVDIFTLSSSLYKSLPIYC